MTRCTYCGSETWEVSQSPSGIVRKRRCAGCGVTYTSEPLSPEPGWNLDESTLPSPLPTPPPCECGSRVWHGGWSLGEFECMKCGRRWPQQALPAAKAFDGQRREQLVRELSEVLNRNGVDAQLRTPDYVLAEYVLATLVALGQAAEAAERHRMGGGTDLVAVTEIPVRGPR
jgi:hypothetical protein